LLRLVAIGDQPGGQVDDEIGGAAVVGMFDLRDVFELIKDGLDQGAFAQQPGLLGSVLGLRPHVFPLAREQVDAPLLPDLGR